MARPWVPAPRQLSIDPIGQPPPVQVITPTAETETFADLLLTLDVDGEFDGDATGLVAYGYAWSGGQDLNPRPVGLERNPALPTPGDRCPTMTRSTRSEH